MNKELPETTNLCVELMNSKRQAMGKLSHVAPIRFAVWRKRDA